MQSDKLLLLFMAQKMSAPRLPVGKSQGGNLRSTGTDGVLRLRHLASEGFGQRWRATPLPGAIMKSRYTVWGRKECPMDCAVSKSAEDRPKRYLWDYHDLST